MDLKEMLPIPDLTQCKRLLCIQPHPDDNEIGAGATLAVLSRLGTEVINVTVTDGRLGTLDPRVRPDELVALRKAEVLAAAEILGISQNIFLTFPDGGSLDVDTLVRRLVRLIREIEPDMLMTVDPFLPYEAHPDHRSVGMAVAQACLFSAFPHFADDSAMTPAKQWGVQGIAFYNSAYPNTFVKVDETWELKGKALAAHASQFSAEELEKYLAYFDYKSRQLAEGCGFEHAESFKVLTPLHLHVNVDTLQS